MNSAIFGRIVVAMVGCVLYLLAFSFSPLSIGTTGWIILGVVSGSLAGLASLLTVLPVIPGLIESLSNRPNARRLKIAIALGREPTLSDYQASEFGFFTFIQPGQVKMIERGGSFVRAVMDWDGKQFEGEGDNKLTPDQPDYWNVRKTPEKECDSHPIPFPGRRPFLSGWFLYAPISILFWLWKRYVFKLTGGVFTGVYPFQRVRTYPIRRDKIVKVGRETTLVHAEDYSDHYRVSQFQYPVAIQEVDTKDKIPLDILVNSVSQVINPFKMAYSTGDEWTNRLITAITNGVTEYARPRPLDIVQSAESKEKASEFAETVKTSTKASVEEFGLEIIRIEILDITPTDAQQKKDLGDVAIAKVEAESAKIRARGTAAPIREVGKALREFPDAKVVVETEAMVRATEKAGDRAMIFFNYGDRKGSMSPGEAAIVRELQNKQGGQNSLPPNNQGSDT